METEDVRVVDVAHAGCGDRRIDGHKMALIRVVVDVDCNGVLLGLGVAWELRDEIHTDMFPRSRGDFLRLESRLRIWGGLVPLTLVAAEHVAADIGRDARPPVVPRDQLEGGVFSRVSGRGRVVARLDDVVA